jgi:hypothetical protein
MKSLEDLVAALGVAFELETAERPAMTLRSGDSIDVYGPVYPFDPALDAISDDYLNRFADGLNYLDAISWRHYLPAFGAFALAHKGEGSNVVGALIASLRPPDREPPRLGSLSPAQEAVLRQLLEVLAFAEDSAWQNDACQALEEWWIENPLYRPSP